MMWATRQGIICSMSHYNTQDYTLYQVKIDADTKRVHVACLGIYCVDNQLKEWYDCVDDLPKWVQEKLAVLMMLEPKLDYKSEIGYRASDHEFYIHIREGEKVNGKN
jgi:hypothetical protein